MQLNDSVIVGSINYIFKFSMDLKILKKVLPLEPTAQEKEKCKTSRVTICQNSVISLNKLPDGNFLACGTYALSPPCWTLDENLEIKNVVIRKDIPHMPHADVVVLNADPFILIGSENKGISKSMRMSSPSEVFDSPRFVSAYNLDNTGYSYFFLRERTIETNGRQVIYSVVARICKYDDGHKQYAIKEMLSVLKAHLVCKKNGPLVPVYYDELQSTHEVTINNERYIYAVFSTFSESAICRYKVQDIIDVFEYSDIMITTVKGGKKTTAKQEMSTNRNALSRKNCNVNYKTIAENIDDLEVFIEVGQSVLLSESINADQNEAVFSNNGVFTSIASDKVSDKETGKEELILFIGTADGYVYKIAMEKEARIVEKIQVFEQGTRVLKVDSFADIVYAGGADGVAAFSVQRCSSYMLCRKCLMNEDPYCSWKGSSCVERSLADEDDNITKPEQCPPVPNDLKCSITQVRRSTLQCQLSSSSLSMPKIIGWSVDSQEIGASDPGYIISMEPMKSILIINVDLTSTGIYDCIIATDEHRNSCSFKLESQESLSTPSTINTISSNILTTLPATTRQQSTISTISAATRATDLTAIITPSIAPVVVNDKKYLPPFVVSLVLLLLVLLIMLFVISRRMYMRRKSPGNLDRRNKDKYGISEEKNGKETAIDIDELLPRIDNEEIVKVARSDTEPLDEANVVT